VFLYRSDLLFIVKFKLTVPLLSVHSAWKDHPQNYYRYCVGLTHSRSLSQWVCLRDRFVRNGSTFVRMLAAGSVQMCSYVVSSQLPPLSSKLAPPLPPSFTNAAGKKEYACVSMAAGEISMVLGRIYLWLLLKCFCLPLRPFCYLCFLLCFDLISLFVGYSVQKHIMVHCEIFSVTVTV